MRLTLEDPKLVTDHYMETAVLTVTLAEYPDIRAAERELDMFFLMPCVDDKIGLNTILIIYSYDVPLGQSRYQIKLSQARLEYEVYLFLKKAFDLLEREICGKIGFELYDSSDYSAKLKPDQYPDWLVETSISKGVVKLIINTEDVESFTAENSV